MNGTATHDGYGVPPWAGGPGRFGPPGNGAHRNGPPWSDPPWGPPWGGWHPAFGHRMLWIAVTILAFMAWWPIGLAVLLFMIGSRRMGCGWHGYRGQAGNDAGWCAGWKAGDGTSWWTGWKNGYGAERQASSGEARQASSSGNRAFDEYRADTLRRLEEEQREFASFLDRLRFAKDKAEFDTFMTERREHPEPPPEPAAG